MATIFGALFPIFAFILIGFLAGKQKWFGEDADHALNAFVANLALPLLVFHVMATMNAKDLLEPVMFAVVVGAAAITYVVHYLYERRKGLAAHDANAAAFGAAYCNHAFVGLPVCLAVLGPASLAPAAVVMALSSAIVFGGGMIASVLTAPRGDAAALSHRESIRFAMRKVGSNPLVIAALAGGLFALLPWRLWGPVDQFMQMISATTAPCALIAVGLFMARPVPQAAGTGASVRAIIGKLILFPALTALLLIILPPMPPIWRDTAMVMAAMPTAVGCFVLARYGGDSALRMSARIIALTTVFAGLSLPLWLWAIGAGQ